MNTESDLRSAQLAAAMTQILEHVAMLTKDNDQLEKRCATAEGLLELGKDNYSLQWSSERDAMQTKIKQLEKQVKGQQYEINTLQGRIVNHTRVRERAIEVLRISEGAAK